MKKKAGIVLVVLLGFSALGLGISQSSASQAEPKLSFDKIEQLVKDQYPGEITDWELEKDRNKAVYEVEIRNDDKEYDIKLDGNTGEILELEEQLVAGEAEQPKSDTAENKADDSTSKTKKDNDKKSDVSMKENNNSAKENNKDSKKDDNGNGTNSSERTAIDSSIAKQIAKKAFKGSIISIELDEDDGKRLYEVEMKSKNKEADIEIDAYTGEVIVLSIDTEDDEVGEDKDDEVDDNDKGEDNEKNDDKDDDGDDDEDKENENN